VIDIPRVELNTVALSQPQSHQKSLSGSHLIENQSGVLFTTKRDEVTKVLAIEPSTVCMRIAEPRIARSSTTVELAGLNGEELDLPSEAFDAVLSTWTLCTIPNPTNALAELRRVLKPGGWFHFVEHGHAPDAPVARWQGRIEPLNKRLAGGCHLTRKIPETIEQAGFAVEQLDTYYFEGEPKPFAYTFEGRALRR